jgi:hypothetical protein
LHSWAQRFPIVDQIDLDVWCAEALFGSWGGLSVVKHLVEGGAFVGFGGVQRGDHLGG